jgi:hypothetical protein
LKSKTGLDKEINVLDAITTPNELIRETSINFMYYNNMKYYKIILAGKGAELYPFELNTEQYEKLREGGVEQDELEYDQICEILGVDSYFDSPNETIMGPFPQTFILRVEDEEGKVVYETEVLDVDKVDFEEKYCSDKAFLIIEDYCKGEQVVYDIPLEEDFDIDKLRLKVYDVGCRVEVINEIIYDEKSYEIYKSYGDTTSKGYYYHLTAGI